MRKYHKALIRVFRKVTDLQKSITKQIVKAIYPVHIKTLRNRNTHTTETDVTKVLAYLSTTYNTIYPEVLGERKLKVCEMVYDLTDPLLTIYEKMRNSNILITLQLTRIRYHNM